ncbi:recombinase family protein [Qipengyuania sp. 902]|uniref:recombinase family protein n=1 Tax=Qipengyuania sp. 902 TaxID=3417565 RepID=UPI003EB88900
MTKAFGYVRCSSNSQSAAASIATQNDAITRAAASCGVHLQRMFADVGPAHSGQSELEHLVKTAESSGVRAIVVANKTRLSRSIAELRRLEEKFSAAGIEIISSEG